jgi:hypothetical protein
MSACKREVALVVEGALLVFVKPLMGCVTACTVSSQTALMYINVAGCAIIRSVCINLSFMTEDAVAVFVCSLQLPACITVVIEAGIRTKVPSFGTVAGFAVQIKLTVWILCGQCYWLADQKQ